MKLLLVAFLAAINASKVQVQLEASWNSGPLYLEATEFIHSLGLSIEYHQKEACVQCQTVKC